MEPALLVCSRPMGKLGNARATKRKKRKKQKRFTQRNGTNAEGQEVHYINSHETFVGDKATNGPGIKLDHECHVQPADMSRSRLFKLPTERISFNADVY